ncbi:MAG TPA: hypothetical protein VJ160_06430 [Anaerolineales bacterium]|nr:hypothetical protein [Anaerolineales bacterium]
MAAIPPSGKTLPAPFAAAYLHVIVDLLGPNGVDAVLRLAGLETWIGRPPAVPDSTPADFADISSLLGALDETLGSRGGRGLERRMGAKAFHDVLQPAGALAAMTDPAFQAFPLERRLRTGMHALARTLDQMTSAGVSSREEPGEVVFRLEACPSCWGRTSDGPVCAATIGLLAAAAAWMAPEAETTIEETACRAHGSSTCDFSIRWEAAA